MSKSKLSHKKSAKTKNTLKKTPALPAEKIPQGDSRWWVVRNSKIHGRGIYARCEIPEGTRIIEYTGEKITKAESNRRGMEWLEKAKKNGDGAVYLFVLNKRHDLDGNTPDNTARLINHSCDPNCEALIIRGKIWVVALRDIPEGTELSFNYGFELDNWHEHPCQCGAKRCINWIVAEEHWPELRQILKKNPLPM